MVPILSFCVENVVTSNGFDCSNPAPQGISCDPYCLFAATRYFSSFCAPAHRVKTKESSNAASKYEAHHRFGFLFFLKFGVVYSSSTDTIPSHLPTSVSSFSTPQLRGRRSVKIAQALCSPFSAERVIWMFSTLILPVSYTHLAAAHRPPQWRKR